MRTFLSFFLLTSLFVLHCSAQQKKLTLENIFSDRSMYPSSVQGIQAHFSETWFTWVNNDQSLVKIDGKGTESTLITLEELNKALTSVGVAALKSFPAYIWINTEEIRIITANTSVAVHVFEKKARVICGWNKEAQNADVCSVSDRVAFTMGNNLYISLKGDEKAITTEKNTGIVCGQTVHRNEFGISKGTYWSPNGSKLAFYRMDESMVSEYPLVDITERVGTENAIRYPMAGMTSHEVSIGVYDLATEKTIFLNTGTPADQYLTNISWSPDEKFIYAGILNRDQNHLKWNQYDASTGSFVRTIFEETSDRYVEPMNPIVFIPGSNDKFILQSQRDGFNHIYLFESNGKLIRQLTKGAWMVTKVGGFDAKGEKLWFTSTAISPLENHAFILTLKNGKTERLTSESGTHNVILTKDFTLMLDQYSAIDMASACQVKTSAGKVVKTLLIDQNPLKDYLVPVPEMITLMAEDSTPLYGRLLKPVHFDPEKKYPVIVYVYGGPHAQLVTNTWTGGAGMFQYYLASKGYVVFTLDNRGSANRGLNFESAIFRQCGTVEVEDQMTGVNWLRKQPWIDTTRMGVHGWSYGGFMTMSLMLKHPGIFKAGVAGGPVIDWKYYEVIPK